MNKNLILTLNYRSTDQGFAIPIALGMGLVMILISATMIVRSQSNQVTASAQKATADSLGVSEIGITRVQSLLKRFPRMAQKPKSEWAAEYNRLSVTNTCLSNTQDSDLITHINDWISVDSTDPTKGEFKILDYTYTGNVGTLKVEGRARSESGSATASLNNATTSLLVKIPVVPLNNLPFPGLWAKNFTMGNNKVNGNVLVAGCSIPAGITTANIVPVSGNLTVNPSVEYPPLPDLPPLCPIQDGNGRCYQLYNPSVNPVIPTSIDRAAVTTTETHCLKDSDGYVVKEKSNGDVERIKPLATECTASNYYTTIKALTLPRVTDVKGSDDVYRYLIGKNTEGNSISLQGGDQIIITAGKKVVFYLQGNVELKGNSQIVHTGTPPTNFQVYGSDGGGKYKNILDTIANTNYITTSITLSGNTSANMFIYAPEATVGVNGGGNVASTITGSVWAKTWNGSSANQLVVTQSAAWTNLPFGQPTRIGSIQSWQREQATN